MMINRRHNLDSEDFQPFVQSKRNLCFCEGMNNILLKLLIDFYYKVFIFLMLRALKVQISG